MAGFVLNGATRREGFAGAREAATSPEFSPFRTLSGNDQWTAASRRVTGSVTAT
jgi:hypothetical protein